jgi:hypothetical protein
MYRRHAEITEQETGVLWAFETSLLVLGVNVGSLVRLFRADAEAEFEQPVWMVITCR